MKYTTILYLALHSFIAGLCLYAYQKEWIIVLPPCRNNEYKHENMKALEHKTVSLFFFKHKKWNCEKNNIIWSLDTAENIKTITNNLLMLLEEEKLIENDIQVLSVIISPLQEAFISFNKEPFDKQISTYTKLMIIQGMLKSLHKNNIHIQSVRFLVHHQLLHDDHLNFSIPWPVSGFMDI